MEKILPALCFAFVAACIGAIVPQNSPDKYYFSRPNTTNIIGSVIGDPPDYNVIRREDVAWLYEAANERLALQWGTTNNLEGVAATVRLEPTFGRWPLSDSNRFVSVVTAREWVRGQIETNIIIGYSIVTNHGQGVDRPKAARIYPYPSFDIDTSSRYGYLSPHGADWLDDDIAVNQYPLPAHTNIVSVTNLVADITQKVEYVTMPMTNGAMSVWTNKWQEMTITPEVEMQTNIAPGQTIDVLFAGGRFRPYAVETPQPLEFIPRYSAIANLYGWLRGMTRLADFGLVPTNEIMYTIARWNGGQWESWTNETRVGEMYISVSAYSTPQGARGYGAWPVDDRIGLVFKSRFHKDVVYAGGIDRIKTATLYVIVYGEWKIADAPTWTRGYYAVRLGEIAREAAPSADGFICFSGAIPKDIFFVAAGALGAWFPSFDVNDTDDCLYFMEFAIVYDMAPWTSLPGW